MLQFKSHEIGCSVEILVTSSKQVWLGICFVKKNNFLLRRTFPYQRQLIIIQCWNFKGTYTYMATECLSCSSDGECIF